jgi:hypothetical protein
MSTDLYDRTIVFDYGDRRRADLMAKVWSATPFMIDCFTGPINSERERQYREWLHDNMGPQASPIHKREGDWQFGGAVIHGWTWLGFKTEAQMKEFLARFPDAIREEKP